MHGPSFLITTMLLSFLFPLLNPIVLKNNPIRPKFCLNPMNLKIQKTLGFCGLGIPVKYYKKIKLHVLYGHCRIVSIRPLRGLPPTCMVYDRGLVSSVVPDDLSIQCTLTTVDNKTMNITFYTVLCPMNMVNDSFELRNVTITYIKTDKGNYAKDVLVPRTTIVKARLGMCWINGHGHLCLINTTIDGKTYEKPILFKPGKNLDLYMSYFYPWFRNEYTFVIDNIKDHGPYYFLNGKYVGITIPKPTQRKYCIQVVVRAYDPIDHRIHEYPTPCDRPNYTIPVKQYKELFVKRASCYIVGMGLYDVKHRIDSNFLTIYDNYYVPVYMATLNCSIEFKNGTVTNNILVSYGILNNTRDIGLLANERFHINNTIVLLIKTPNGKSYYLFKNWTIPRKDFIVLGLENSSNNTKDLIVRFVGNNTTMILKHIHIKNVKLIRNPEASTKIKYSNIIMSFGPTYGLKNYTKIYLFINLPVIGSDLHHRLLTIYIPKDEKPSIFVSNSVAFVDNNTLYLPFYIF